ncbi:PfkB domain protein [Thioalkalivibrio sulfidiphilus HL-EbGr7]|uniref:PfkB domain protein n=1 Tax=Thioalkalivibrio sulfidiphilus (strain HL-EbGR7) TaxID=396588 RepID=B8GTF6_THISH|nr:PfkB family carbohydrate kinase [Thioalkalivibrio sulfidiphilus]ACL71216.1 PfkB domain protein [Thioalkalivibrio sulfidiphilus HL-EbGr7]
MSHILAIGIATLDIVNTVDHYPVEDEELRASAQRVVPGGNAANSAWVLSQLGHRVDLAAVLAREPDGERLAGLLSARGIGLEHCAWREGRTPCSYITVNARNGSRTIVHYRDLPELDAAHLAGVSVERMDWVHLEARDGAITGAMLRTLRERLVDQPVSLEVEKERPGVDRLFGLPDVILFSRPFARGRGFESAEAFLRDMGGRCRKTILVCTWGEAGAWARDGAGRLHHAPAVSPPRVVDTLGAGDTFNAGLVHGLASGRTVPEALAFAVRLAGRKVGQAGLDGLGVES